MTIRYSSQFKKDFKKARQRALPDLKLLFDLIGLLEKNDVLETRFKDHALSGNYSGFRECHVQPDWLLIYRITDDELQLVRLGSHSDLF